MYVTFYDAGTGEVIEDVQADIVRTHYNGGKFISQDSTPLVRDSIPRLMYTENLSLRNNDDFYVYMLENITIPDGYWVDHYIGSMNSGRVYADAHELRQSTDGCYFTQLISIYLANADTPAKTTPSYSGTIPAGYTTTTAPNVQTTTAVPVAVSHPGNTPGDANGDKKVDIADAVTIMQYLANPEKYKISKGYEECADCVDKGSGITSIDALGIQLVEAQTISADKLPLTSEEIRSFTQ